MKFNQRFLVVLLLGGLQQQLSICSNIFDFQFQSTLDISFKENEEFFKSIGKHDHYFKSLYEESVSSYIIPAQPTNNEEERGMIELVCKIPIQKGPLINREENANLLKLGANMPEAERFKELDLDLGLKLLQPLTGKCFTHTEDIWLYRFCVGDRVEQFHVEANGSYSEEFQLGTSVLASDFDAQASKLDFTLDDPIQDMILFIDDQKYLVIDQRSGGYVVRIYSNQPTPNNGSSTKYKNDLIGIAQPQSDGSVRFETRVIIEVVNDYTFILEKPFDNMNLLPNPTIDFKIMAAVGGAKSSKSSIAMTSQDLHLHLKAYGLEILHARFVFCKRCQFAMTYQVGDTLLLEYFGRHYASRIIRILEDNLMEIEKINGNDEPVIVVEKYFILDKQAGVSSSTDASNGYDWKTDRKSFPKLRVEGGPSFVYAYSQGEESLIKTFKEGDRLVFLNISAISVKSQKNRKISGPVFTVMRFINNGQGMEMKAEQDLVFPEGQILTENTKDYVMGVLRLQQEFQLPSLSELTRLSLDGNLQGHDERRLFKTVHSLSGNKGVFIMNLNLKQPQTMQHNLRMIIGSTEDQLELVYNSKHGMLINGNFLDFRFKNESRLYLIIDKDTMYISTKSPFFADIIYQQNLTKPFQDGQQIDLFFDLEYSSEVDVSMIRTIDGIPSRLRQQLDLYSQAPASQKSYFVEKFVNGTMCAVNQQPREVTIFYYCDYFNSQSDFVLLELSEPDWCKYHVKVATKHLCGKGNMEVNYDSYKNQNQIKCMPRLLESNDFE